MRLADKLLFCAAIIYTIERAVGVLTGSAFWDVPSYLGNAAIYVFLVLAVIEYAKLFIPWVKKRKSRQSAESNACDMSKQNNT